MWTTLYTGGIACPVTGAKHGCPHSFTVYAQVGTHPAYLHNALPSRYDDVISTASTPVMTMMSSIYRGAMHHNQDANQLRMGT